MVYLSWIEKTKEKSLFKFSVLNNDTWSVPDTITSGNNWFVNWADYPMLAADGAGNMIAHILEKSENGKYTYDVKLS
ncbi:MAG: exo-alpha-sialidase, partial [Chitinophagaceae bacterium]|nr:exo-alpha-sialidase [Chitinophagaceae bacterium]